MINDSGFRDKDAQALKLSLVTADSATRALSASLRFEIYALEFELTRLKLFYRETETHIMRNSKKAWAVLILLAVTLGIVLAQQDNSNTPKKDRRIVPVKPKNNNQQNQNQKPKDNDDQKRGPE